MSMGILCNAVKTRLLTLTNFTVNNCDIGLDAMPNPSAGEQFIRIHPGYWRTRPAEGLDEEYGVDITVTRRLGVVPPDRWGSGIWIANITGTTALESLIRTILKAIWLDAGADAVLAAANAAIGGSASGFVEPFQSCDPGLPMLKGPEWWCAEGDQTGAFAGVAWTMRFGGARRIQTIETMVDY